MVTGPGKGGGKKWIRTEGQNGGGGGRIAAKMTVAANKRIF